MPTTTSTTTTTTPIAITGTDGTKGTQGTSKSLGKDDFLKLFVAQLQHQDPMNPMDDMDFMGQMASFTTLEQVSKLASANEALASQQTMSNAVALIGRQVTYTGADQVAITGTVERVDTKDGKPALRIGGVDGIDPTKITQVA
jgi:flagellar basal-body rod modification protein FlgD